jgi:pilus assembly protein CpaE
MYVFCSAKGGAGVTTIALNFAVALAEASGKKTALIDLDLPLGDAALDLGVVGKYSTIDALNNVHRLDTAYLEALMVRHESGISFLGAPGTHLRVEVPKGATEKLITVARRTFENVIVDVGSRWSWIDPALLDQAKTIYLITQVGIPELRNSNRVMIGGLAPYSEKVEVVLNRYVKKLIQVGESVIEKALTKPVRWLVPSDYVTVRDMQTAARPLVNDNTRIAQVIRSMANEAARVQEAPSIKRMFSFIG